MASKMQDVVGSWRCNNGKYRTTTIKLDVNGILTAEGIPIYCENGVLKIHYPSGVYHGVLNNDTINWCRQSDGARSCWHRVVYSWRKSAAVFKSKINLWKLEDMEYRGCGYVRGRNL